MFQYCTKKCTATIILTYKITHDLLIQQNNIFDFVNKIMALHNISPFVGYLIIVCGEHI